MKYVLDSSAAIAYLRAEPGAVHVAGIFKHPESELAMHNVNLLEVYYKMAMFGGETAAEEAIDDLAAIKIHFYDRIDSELLIRSGFFKSRYPFLSLADSICIALSEMMQATVLASDRPFSNVKDGIKIELIR